MYLEKIFGWKDLEWSSVDRIVWLREDSCRGLIVGKYNVYFENYDSVSFLCIVEKNWRMS